jgi:hypothetical protein
MGGQGMDLKNNLFRYATSELSQDAFLCWLLSFALERAKPDRALQACAKELLELFVPALKGRLFVLTDVERQSGHVDVLLTVVSGSQTYKVIVEDKTFTGEHDNQLQRYLTQLQACWPECVVCGVYYKMGFQSDLSAVRAAGYQIVTRAQMLKLMAGYADQTKSEIFLDYYAWWNEYHQQTLRYRELPLDQWNSEQIFGFYDDLQTSGFAESRHVWMGYDYVANKKGGFDGLWTGLQDDHVKILGISCALYLQIEPEWNAELGERVFPIRLKLSLEPAEGQQVSAGKIRNRVIYDEAGRYYLTDFRFQRPKRLGSGMHMSIGEYERPSGKTAAQFQEILSAAIEDYRRLLNYLRQEE